jgi:hypothetical protein
VTQTLLALLLALSRLHSFNFFTFLLSFLYSHLDYVLGTAGGGTGAVFDWSVAGKLNIPVILAGRRIIHRGTVLNWSGLSPLFHRSIGCCNKV